MSEWGFNIRLERCRKKWDIDVQILLRVVLEMALDPVLVSQQKRLARVYLNLILWVGAPAGFRSRPGGDGYDVDFKDDKAARHVRRAVPGAPQRAASAS